MKEILHQKAQELTASSTKSLAPTLKKTGLPIISTVSLIRKLQARYGHKWLSAIEGIEEAVVSEWSQGLSGLTDEQINLGLETWNGDWPPSLPEFKKACSQPPVKKYRDLNEWNRQQREERELRDKAK